MRFDEKEAFAAAFVELLGPGREEEALNVACGAAFAEGMRRAQEFRSMERSHVELRAKLEKKNGLKETERREWMRQIAALKEERSALKVALNLAEGRIASHANEATEKLKERVKQLWAQIELLEAQARRGQSARAGIGVVTEQRDEAIRWLRFLVGVHDREELSDDAFDRLLEVGLKNARTLLSSGWANREAA